MLLFQCKAVSHQCVLNLMILQHFHLLYITSNCNVFCSINCTEFPSIARETGHFLSTSLMICRKNNSERADMKMQITQTQAAFDIKTTFFPYSPK